MKGLLVLLFIAAIFVKCSSKDFEGSSKFESALNMKLREMLSANKSGEIGIILKVKDSLKTSQKKMLEETGITLGSVTGNIFTATGTPKEIIKLDDLDFVTQVQLAKRNYLKGF